jgi:hypothetical protein
VVFHDFPDSQRQSQEKDDVIAQLIALLEDGRKAGVWAFPDARSAALIVFDGMHAVVDDTIVSGLRDPEPPCRLLEEMFTRMLAASRARAKGRSRDDDRCLKGAGLKRPPGRVMAAMPRPAGG